MGLTKLAADTGLGVTPMIRWQLNVSYLASLSAVVCVVYLFADAGKLMPISVCIQ